jgi:hypothetical protein
MQGLAIEAIYEHGTLKLPRQLPLVGGQQSASPPTRPGGLE